MLDKDKTDIQQKRILRNWKESWEKKNVTPSGDIILLEELRKKYVDLKLDEMERDQDIYTIFDVELEKRRGNNTYQLIELQSIIKKK